MGIHLQEDSEAEESVGPSFNKLASLWPQSFGRTMDIYSRSTSQRSQPNAEDQCSPGCGSGFLQESSNNCSSSASSTHEPEKILQEPLLWNDNHCAAANEDDLETADGLCASNSEADGSSFAQAVFNGMNVLAGKLMSTPGIYVGGRYSVSFFIVPQQKPD